MRNTAPSPASRKSAGAWLVVVVCLALSGCSLPWDREPAEPKPSRSARLNTVAAAAEGDRIVVTASVRAVLDDRAFVVSDVDLPAQGLLVLTPVAADVQTLDLVTVDGVLRRFAFQAFRVPFGLGESAPYQPFEGRKMMVAGNLTSFA
ncbi:MAG TPA: hypothetical protein VFH03_05620 [Actinoplanes sp.]|nr:hypothetical protein [Actinoplanes sp.]